MKAVVMGGGQGSRLRPLTCNLPKPLVPVCNKPVMEYTVELLKRHGATTLLVTLHYLADEIMSYFGYGSDWGLKMLYSIEDEPLGTAGSVKKVEESLDDAFLVISGDALTDFDLSAAVKFHRQRKSAATIVLTRVDNPLEFGMVITDDDSKVVRFLEKPSWGEVFSDTINTGIYVLDPSILKLMEPGQPYDFSKDLFPMMLEKELPIYGYVAEGYWCDIGSLDQYQKANRDVLMGRVKHRPPGEMIREGVWVGKGTRIHPGASLETPVVIGRNCRIRENARVLEGTVVGDNCIVEEGASLHRDVLWDNTFIGRKVRCQGTTLCRRVTLKSNVTVGEGAVLGDKVFVGEGALLQPQVKIWPDKNIEPGATVSLSLIWGNKWPGSLFDEGGITGLGNIEVTSEFALKLGAAYGATLEKGSVVLVSRDSHPCSRLTQRSLICGLVSVGINVRDLRVTPSPISRSTLMNTAAVGGIHTRVARDDIRSVHLDFFDHRGISIGKVTQRKIENNFFREEFRRTTMDEVGVIDFPSRSLEQFLEHFSANLAIDLVRQAGFKVVIDYNFGNASVALSSILGKLGCETVSLNAHLEPIKAREQLMSRGRSMQQLSDIVTTLKADLGVLMDVDAERMSVVDERGQIVEGARLLTMMALLLFRQNKSALVAVPVTAPSALEKLASDHGGKLIWTSTDTRSLTHTANLGRERIAMAGCPNGSLVFPKFSPGFDAMYAFARLLEMMATEKLPLSEMVSWIPNFHLHHQSIACGYQEKGRVMRRLIEDSRQLPTQMIDGLKVFLPSGWVLVVPAQNKPALHLWTEGETPEEATELARQYSEKIENLRAIAQPVRAVKSNTAGRTEKGDPLPEDRAFHFWTPGRYLGVRARTYNEFLDTLHYIEPASLSYHFQRGDFSNWVEYELKDGWLAEQIRQLKTDTQSGEDLRNELLTIFSHTPGRGNS
ncbi:MAG: mannose-1-phosphate guanyltransferase [Candidatus Eremiobacteraeota bacterium]|nr:mannose-1-phosphate guanyltransferase [Candidatus Eremiobacteraeota bacterium]